MFRICVYIFRRVFTLHPAQGVIPFFDQFHIFQQPVLQQQLAPQENANCHEYVMRQIQNIITDVNSLLWLIKIHFKWKNEEIECTAQEGRPVLYLY